MSKKLFVFLLVLMVAGLTLAACQGQKAQCTDTIGCVEVKKGDPIHLAYAMVISGPDATLGTDSRNGIEIAIADKGGKLLGHDIKFDGEDDQCSAEGGQSAGTSRDPAGVRGV